MSEKKDWRYSINGVEYGPVSEEQLNQRISRGEVPRRSMVHKWGMEDWTPVTEAFPDIEVPEHAIQAYDATNFNIVPGCRGYCNLTKQYCGYDICSGCIRSIYYRRIAAYFIDRFLMMFFPFLAMIGVMIFWRKEFMLLPDQTREAVLGFVFLLAMFGSIFLMLLKDLLAGGRSLGKLIVGLKIIDVQTGEPPEAMRLIQRNFPLFLMTDACGLSWIFGLTMLMQVDRTGQRWGERMTGTMVVNNH